MRRVPWCVAAAALGTLLWPSSAAGDPVATLESCRAELRAMLARRVARDLTRGEAIDVRLTLEGAVGREPLSVSLRRRGDAWIQANADTAPEGLCVEAVDATSLDWVGGHLTGDLTVLWRLAATGWSGRRGQGLADRFHPRGHIPETWEHWHLPDRGELTRRYPISYTFDAEGAIDGDSARGTYRATSPDGSWLGELTAVARRPEVRTLASEDPRPTGGSNARAARAAAEIYRQCCLLDLALARYPRTLEEVEPLVAVPSVAPSLGEEASAAYVYELARLVARRTEDGPEPPAPRAPGDPDFGPFLPHREWSPPRLPVVKTLGAQEWVRPARWRFLGPFRVPDDPTGPRLPEVVASHGSLYTRPRSAGGVPERGEAPPGHDGLREETLSWIPAPLVGGRVRPPLAPGVVAAGDPSFAWYAATRLVSPIDQVVWCGLEVRDRGALWVNGRLVWRSGQPGSSAPVTVLALDLVAGDNDLLVRCASDPRFGAPRHERQVTYFEQFAESGIEHPRGALDLTWLRLSLCLAGAPRTSAEVAADREAETPPGASTARSLGHRRDGRSHYPDASPPLAWDADRRSHELWSRPLPTGFGEPVVWSDRLFVTAEPDTLVCLRADTGEVVWTARETETPTSDGGPAADWTFRAATTPVVTEARVWAVFGTGAVVCFDHDGARRWRRELDVSWSHPAVGSPLLAPGTLVIQVPEGGSGTRSPGRHAFRLLGLDPSTGAIRWRASRAGGFGAGITLASLRRRDRERSVILTGAGQVLDPASGKVLHDEVTGIEGNGAAPVVEGQTAVWAPALGVEAVRLWIDAAGRVGCRPLWSTRRTSGFGQNCANGRYGPRYWFRGPVIHQGLVYTLRTDTAHVPGHHNLAWLQLDAYDLRSGQLVAQVRPALRDSLDPCVPPVVVADRLFLVDGGSPVGGFGASGASGRVAVVDTRFPPEVVGTSRIGKTRASPTFAEGRMFVRTHEALVCMATRTEEDARIQSDRLARGLFERIGRRPARQDALEVRGLPSGSLEPGVPVTTVTNRSMPSTWLVAGPVPTQDTGDDTALLERISRTVPGPGSELVIGASRATLTPHRATAGRLELATPAQRRRGNTTYFLAVVEARRAGAYRFELRPRGVSLWIDGRRVRSREVARLVPGRHSVLLRVDVLQRLPPFGKAMVDARFVEVADPAAAWSAWIGRIRRHRDDLLALVSSRAGSSWATRAQECLDTLAREEARR